MNPTAKRLYAVAAIIIATYGISRLVQAQTEPPEVDPPDWTFRQLPTQLGTWHGEDTKLDPAIAMATGADVIVNRLYRDAAGHSVTMHAATFTDPSVGVGHSPTVCYISSGWKLINTSFENVQASKDSTIAVKLSAWEREGETVLVACWYQLGGHVLYERLDLGGVRWTMRGQPKWPVLDKIMLQISASESEDAKTAVLAFAEQVAKWLNQPEHRKYLDRWPGA